MEDFAFVVVVIHGLKNIGGEFLYPNIIIYIYIHRFNSFIHILSVSLTFGNNSLSILNCIYPSHIHMNPSFFLFICSNMYWCYPLQYSNNNTKIHRTCIRPHLQQYLIGSSSLFLSVCIVRIHPSLLDYISQLGFCISFFLLLFVFFDINPFWFVSFVRSLVFENQEFNIMGIYATVSLIQKHLLLMTRGSCVFCFNKIIKVL